MSAIRILFPARIGIPICVKANLFATCIVCAVAESMSGSVKISDNQRRIVLVIEVVFLVYYIDFSTFL